MTEPADIAAELLRHGAATLGECGAHPLPSRIRPVWPGAALAGPALPVRCTPGDNLAIHVAVASAGPGTVLAVDVGDEPERGYWGEVLTTAARARGLAGLVIDGGVRDTEALGAHRFPVFAAGVALPGTTKRRPGSVGRAVAVAGVTVGPGDWIVGDADGVVVIPAEARDDVLAAARARVARELGLFGALRGGASTLELLDLDPSLVDRA